MIQQNIRSSGRMPDRETGTRMATAISAVALLLLLANPLSAADAPALASRKVTISSGGGRLHKVLDEVAKASGLRIRCGKNTSDWQVRDLPIDVYTKDIPPEKLLGWIAEASHLSLTTGEIALDNGTTVATYSVRRDRQGEAELAADEVRQLAEAGWTWDVFKKLGQEPESGFPAHAGAETRSNRLIGKIIASLPEGSKQNVLSGEAILLDASSSRQAQTIRELAKLTAGSAMTAARGSAEESGSPVGQGRSELSVAVGPSLTETQTDSDARQTMLRIQMFDRGTNKGCSIVFTLSPIVFDPLVISYDLELKASDSDAERLGLTPRASGGRTKAHPDYDCSGSKRMFVVSAKDWEQPFLASRVRLDLPDGDRTYADLLSALAKATGYSIVCEDYNTGRIGPTPTLKGIKEDTTVGAVLRALDSCWFCVDEKERLILGWAENWRGHHRDLVQENLLAGLAKKVAGAGADLDDVSPLASLTSGQIDEWISPCCNSRVASYATLLLNRMLWRIYDALSPEAKASAKTTRGTSLGGLDLDALRQDFRRLRRYDETTVIVGTFKRADKSQTIQQYSAISSALADPALLQESVLRVVSREVEGGRAYWLEFDLPQRDGGFTMSVDGGPTVFPIRASAKR